MLSLRHVIGTIISSNFGQNKSYKVVVDEKENYFCQCPLLLLQKVHLKDPFTCLVEETLFAHHEQFGCSTKSLLAMWFLWDAEFRKLIEEGCKVRLIIKFAQVLLENVISQISGITFKIDKILFPDPKNFTNDAKTLGKQNTVYGNTKNNSYKIMPEINEILSGKCNIGVKYSSRHFSPFMDSELKANEEIKDIGEVIFENDGGKEYLSEEVSNGLYDVVQKLSHGNQEHATLAHEIWVQQVLATKILKFNTEGIIICPITTSSDYSAVIQGLLIKSNFNNFWNQDLNNIESYKALVIKGSIKFEYVHLGFNPKIPIMKQMIVENLNISEREIWIKKCCNLISKLDIKVLFIKEDIDPDIASFCHSHSIFIFSNLPWKIMKVLHKAFNAKECSYLLDCDEKNVVSNVSIEKWNILENEEYYLVNCILCKKANFYTVILCHPSAPVLSSHEHQFWHLLSRLHLASEHSLLPGGGKSEKWCGEMLEKMCFQNSSKMRIITALAQGFSSYAKILNANFDMDPIIETLEDNHSKVNSWRSALSLVLLTLQCDFLLVNDSGHAGDPCLNNLVAYL